MQGSKAAGCFKTVDPFSTVLPLARGKVADAEECEDCTGPDITVATAADLCMVRPPVSPLFPPSRTR